MQMEERRDGFVCRAEQDADPRHRISFRFKLLQRLIRSYIDRRVAGTGVYRSQHQLLMYLSREPDCSQTALARRLEVSSAAVAVSLKKLEQGGFVQRSNEKDDNRRNRVQLTQKGQDAVNTGIAIFRELDRNLFQGFTQEELTQLEGFLIRIGNNLEKSEGNKGGER